MALWNGSITADTVVSNKHVQMIDMINVALDTANATQITSPRADLAFMGNMVRTMEGVAGTYELYESFTGYFQDDSDFLDPEEFEEEYDRFIFKRRGYAVKNGSYDKKTFQDYEERGVNLDEIIQKRTIELIATYNNIYKPNIIFETLMTVPSDGSGVAFPFGKTFGAIRNYSIKERKMRNYDSTATAQALNSNVRNNWRTIASGTGVTLDDMNFYKQYMGDIEGIDEDNLVVYGNSASISQLKSLYSDFSPTTEEIISNGVPTGVQGWSVDGLTLVVAKTPFPKDTLCIINPDAQYLISKLVSKMPKYQGLAIDFPTDQEKFLSNAKNFQGSKMLIQQEGYHMTGVLDVLWVDIDGSNASADRLMQSAGFDKITQKAKDLKAKWYKSVTDKA